MALFDEPDDPKLAAYWRLNSKQLITDQDLKLWGWEAYVYRIKNELKTPVSDEQLKDILTAHTLPSPLSYLNGLHQPSMSMFIVRVVNELIERRALDEKPSS